MAGFGPVTVRSKIDSLSGDALDSPPRTPLELRAFIDGIPALAFSALQDGSLELANQRWLDYCGVSLAQLRAEWRSLLHPDDAEGKLRWWEEVRRSGQPGQTEVRWRRADGEFRWFQTSVAPIHDDSGTVVGGVETFRDMRTARVR